jgi:hypothetical protein
MDRGARRLARREKGSSSQQLNQCSDHLQRQDSQFESGSQHWRAFVVVCMSHALAVIPGVPRPGRKIFGVFILPSFQKSLGVVFDRRKW